MKKYLVIINLIFSFYGAAQGWFDPGTTLYRPLHVDFSYPGYIKYTSNGTVTINSLTCVQILVETKFVFQGDLSIKTNTYNIITHYNNGLVTKYYPSTNSFDTIYNFNAVVGDKWSLSPKSYTNCAKSKVIVTATGTKTIQGNTLKWLKVTINGYGVGASIFNPLPNVYYDTIIERMGSTTNDFLEGFNLCPWMSDGSYGQWLKCYIDNEIIYNKNIKDTSQCDFIETPVSINKEIINPTEITIHPNPTKDKITINFNLTKNGLNYNSSKIFIFNSLGQLLLSNEINTNEKTTINLSSYPKGIYILKLIDEDLKTFTQKIVVE